MEKILTLTVVAVIGVFIFLLSCETKGMSTVPEQPLLSTSSVAKATANISTQSNGLTVELLVRFLFIPQ